MRNKVKSLEVIRPISDLYKTITHNGKKIVPIVECAKIALPALDWRYGNKNAVALIYKPLDECAGGRAGKRG